MTKEEEVVYNYGNVTGERTMVSLKQLAKETHLSVSTVRRALNDLPDINPRTRRKVSRIAKRLGYRPNLLARGLVTKRTGIIGVSIPDIQLSFYPELIKGVESTLKDKGYRLILWDSEGTLEGLLKGMDIFRDYMVEGIVLVPVPGKKMIINKKLKDISLPYVFVDEYIHPKANFVVTDDVEGGMLATSHLISLGHKRIAHFSGPLENSSASARLTGYKNALEEAGLNFNKRLLFQSDFTIKSGIGCAGKLLNNNISATAIFCANDAAAVGCMKLLLSRGIKIPQDIAIVGYGNLNYSDFLKIPLTTISQPAGDMGRFSANMLFEIIEGKRKNKKQIFLKTELIVRESSVTKI